MGTVRLKTILFILVTVLGISFYFETDKAVVLFSLASATVGGLMAVLGEQYFRQYEELRLKQAAVNALRAEVELNLEIQSYRNDEKLRGYSNSTWQHASQYLLELKPSIYKNLREGYALIHLHRQALTVELIRADQGVILTDCSKRIKENFDAVVSEKDWFVNKSSR